MDYTKKDWSKVPIPQNYTELHEHFGDPSDPNFQHEYLVLFPEELASGASVTVRCHAAMAPALKKIWAANRAHIHSYAGCYNYRKVRGSATNLSLHAWGLAVDLNAPENPLGGTSTQAPQLVAAFKDAGFFWGGNYHHRKDPMHFQYAGDF